MASKIRILDEKTINQIAAGEVIENPASVVKELVDNAIDAKATKIVVEAVNSGRQLLRIQDNGCGMGHDDALLCIERHATSKIRALEDLWALETMGFRGEALSSVASISEFKLLTAPYDPLCEQPEGSLLRVAGGKIVAHERVKCLSGTTIEVKSLFYNVPARKKFMKSPTRDANDIIKVLVQIALANPSIAFELILNHKREFSWQPDSIENRIKEVLGSEFFSELIPVSFGKDGMCIHGFIASPSYSRPTRSHQYLFVNMRPVTSLALSGAVKEAYGSSLDSTRHPAFVLFVDVATSSLDVNVHPQKREVRFSFEDEIKQVIIHAVSSALFARHAPVSAIYPSSSSPSPQVATPSLPISMTPKDSPYAPQHDVFKQEHFQQVAPEQFTQMVLHEPSQQSIVHAVFDDYIIATISWPEGCRVPEELKADGLYIISAKRALSRLAFDGVAQSPDVGKGAIQTLLVPVFIEVAPSEAGQLRELMPQLELAGITISDFGKASFLVQAIPSYLEAASIEDVLRAVLDDDGASGNVAATLAKACKSVKTTKRLTVEVASHVVKKLMESSNPFCCPSGDKTVSMLTKNELEKKFR